MKRVAIYARSSPDCPLSADEQIEHLTTVAIERGWTVAHVFADRPTAVKKDQDRRSGELSLIEAIRSAAIDRVLVWSIDRIGKSLGRSGQIYGDMPLSLCRSRLCTTRDLIARPRMDYRCSMSPRFWPTTCDNPVVTEYCGVRLRLAHCQLDLAGHRSRQPRHSEPNENWLLVRACDRSPRMAGISPASASRIKTSMSAEATGI